MSLRKCNIIIRSCFGLAVCSVIILEMVPENFKDVLWGLVLFSVVVIIPVHFYAAFKKAGNGDWKSNSDCRY